MQCCKALKKINKDANMDIWRMKVMAMRFSKDLFSICGL